MQHCIKRCRHAGRHALRTGSCNEAPGGRLQAATQVSDESTEQVDCCSSQVSCAGGEVLRKCCSCCCCLQNVTGLPLCFNVFGDAGGHGSRPVCASRRDQGGAMRAGERSKVEAARQQLKAECKHLRKSLAEAQSQCAAVKVQRDGQVGLVGAALVMLLLPYCCLRT
jgi:hypothetical protein